jgi:hypothetical protein
VNAPQGEREFIFSPEVGRSIQGSATDWPPTPEEIDRVGIFGRGVLYIEQLNLSPPERGHRASILEIHFYCTVSLPRLSANFPMPNTYQDGPANGSQPLRSETNGPSSAPGSRR